MSNDNPPSAENDPVLQIINYLLAPNVNVTPEKYNYVQGILFNYRQKMEENKEARMLIVANKCLEGGWTLEKFIAVKIAILENKEE